MEPRNLKNLSLFQLLDENRTLSLSFLYQGCITASNSFLTNSSANRTWRLDSSLTADGFILTFPDEDVGGPPTRFVLQSSADGGATWSTVGKPRFRWAGGGARLLDGAAPLAASELRFDLRPPWPWVEQHVLEPAAIAAGLLCAAALGALHQAARAKRAVLWALCALAVGDGAAAAGFAAAGAPREAFTPAASALTYLLLAGALQRSEPLFLDACAGLGLLLLAGGRVAADCAVFDDCGNLAASPPVGSALVAVLALLHAVYRARSAAAAHRALLHERGRRDEEWRRVAAQPGAAAALAELEVLTRTARRSCAAGPPARQLNRRQGIGGTSGDATSSWLRLLLGRKSSAAVPGAAELDGPVAHGWDGPDAAAAAAAEPDPDSPVRSLDQLYAQARPLT